MLDLTTGVLDTFADGTYPIAVAGFAVAVSPDGGRIAYQYDYFVTVFDRATRSKTSSPWSPQCLAGKAAWTPDGQSLAMMYRDTAAWDSDRWELRLVDPVTGHERDALDRPGMAGLSLMRLLGWYGPTGRPVVIGYHGDGPATGSLLGQGVDEVLSINLDSVGVYELAGTDPRTLVQRVPGITAIDVADSVLAGGRTRPGNPPRVDSPWPWLMVAVMVGATGALAVRFVVRWRRRIQT